MTKNVLPNFQSSRNLNCCSLLKGLRVLAGPNTTQFNWKHLQLRTALIIRKPLQFNLSTQSTIIGAWNLGTEHNDFSRNKSRLTDATSIKRCMKDLLIVQPFPHKITYLAMSSSSTDWRRMKTISRRGRKLPRFE